MKDYDDRYLIEDEPAPVKPVLPNRRKQSIIDGVLLRAQLMAEHRIGRTQRIRLDATTIISGTIVTATARVITDEDEYRAYARWDVTIKGPTGALIGPITVDRI